MAIGKTLTDNKGQSTTYHRILVASQVFIDGKESIQINMGGYTNADFRNAEKNSDKDMVVTNTAVTLPIIDEDFSRATLYTRIMAEVPEFADAMAV